MFGLFEAKSFDDPQLGRLTRAAGRWKAECELVHLGRCAVLIAGSRNAPDDASLLLAKQLSARFPALAPALEAAFFEHYLPYRESADANDAVKLEQQSDVWAQLNAERILIEPRQGVPTIEIALRAAWDEEHTLGARIQNWNLLELNGSI